MSDPYLGEVRHLGFTYAPYGWAVCNGATVPLRQYTALFSLIGVTFGGDGTITFMLPNLASRSVAGAGQGGGLSLRTLGDPFGEASVTLITQQIPPHTHVVSEYEGGSGARSAVPTPSSALSGSDISSIYGTGVLDAPMAGVAIAPAGGGAPHENRQPVLPVMACIAMSGVFPQFS